MYKEVTSITLVDSEQNRAFNPNNKSPLCCYKEDKSLNGGEATILTIELQETKVA